MTITDAVVLAAGEGTRLRPLTRNRPKPMLPAANRPVLEYVLDALVDAGIERIHLVVGYRAGRVQDHFGPIYRDVPVDYVHQEKQLGGAHALVQARDAVSHSSPSPRSGTRGDAVEHDSTSPRSRARGDAGDAFLVVNGDQIIDRTMVEEVCRAAEDADAAATLAVLERDDLAEYGAVSLEEGRVVEFEENPRANRYHLLNAGVYAFDERIFEAIAETPRVDGEQHIPDALERLIDDGGVRGVRTHGLWTDATYPWDLLEVARILLTDGRVTEPRRDDGSGEQPESGAREAGKTADGVWIADAATVHDAATLQPPVVIGPDAVVEPGAVVGPYAAVGRNATVGAGAAVRASVLDSDTRVEANATLVDCVTGQGVHVGAGTVVPGGPADVRVGTQVFEDQRLGAVFADRADVGGGVTVDPGTLVGPNATIRTGAHVSGNIPEDAEVRR